MQLVAPSQRKFLSCRGSLESKGPAKALKVPLGLVQAGPIACGDQWMDQDLSETDSEASSLSLVSRHVHNLERRLAHLENIIFALAERLGQLEEQYRVAESHFARTEQLAREARDQATLGRLELDQLAHRLLDLAALD